MGANGFSVEKGASTPDLQPAETKRMLIGIADRVVLLVDSPKIGRNSFAQFASSTAIDCVVTDALSPDIQKALENEGIEVQLGV